MQPAPPCLLCLPPCHESSPLGCLSLTLWLFEFHAVIFWHFRLFIVFRSIAILLLVVQGCVFLPTPLSYPELQEIMFQCVFSSYHKLYMTSAFVLYTNLLSFALDPSVDPKETKTVQTLLFTSASFLLF